LFAVGDVFEDLQGALMVHVKFEQGFCRSRGFYLIVDKFTEQSLVFYTSTLNIAAHSVAL